MNTDRFKFRIWHDTQGMIYPDGTFIRISQDKVMKLDPSIEEPRYFIMPLQDYDIMQSTGLKDVEGNLIYEGDILQGFTKNDEIEFKEEVKFSPVLGYYITNDDIEDDRIMYDNYVSFSDCKIVGNIYETVQE